MKEFRLYAKNLSSIYRRERLSVLIWRGRRDSNPRSSDRQSDALSQLRYVPSNLRANLISKLRLKIRQIGGF
jgi:hypothetical protein